MSLLLECEGKTIFQKIGIPILPGKVAKNLKDAIRVADEINYPVVVKGQILHGGRGKAGLIKVAKDRKELEKIVPEILKGTIKNMNVQSVLVEKAAKIAKEYYISTMFDTYSREIIFILSTAGGVDIETVAAQTPNKVSKERYSLDFDFRQYHAMNILKKLG